MPSCADLEGTEDVRDGVAVGIESYFLRGKGLLDWFLDRCYLRPDGTAESESVCGLPGANSATSGDGSTGRMPPQPTD